MPLLFRRQNLFFIISSSTWYIVFSEYSDKSSEEGPATMWTFLCVTHCGDRMGGGGEGKVKGPMAGDL